jgi:hypothetical protein
MLGGAGNEMRILIGILSVFTVTTVLGQADFEAADPSKHYVFYLHGRIIEDSDPRPTHEIWGLYDYPAVVEALASRGAVVISEQRAKDTDVGEYAALVRTQVSRLVEAGVPQSQISVVGFSKGGAIAITVSGLMPEAYSDIRYVFLAACTDWVSEQRSLSLSGHVLSISEASDDATKGCRGLNEHSQSLGSHSEVGISTGAAHGAFYLPRAEWLVPTLEWVHAG